jgi:Zn-dependent peptidase ImmA (M78 family)
MSVDIEALVNAMKKKRDVEGLSLRALSTVVGISFSSLARIERGDGEPDNNSMIRLLEWLGNDGREAGLTFEHVALVHFRANKNIQSKTVKSLLKIAEILKSARGVSAYRNPKTINYESYTNSSVDESIGLSKAEMEERAEQLRADIGVDLSQPLNALSIEIEGVDVLVPNEIDDLDSSILNHLYGTGSGEWSAMSVPLDEEGDSWVVVRNDSHSPERQKVTYLEECWHILLDHKLTKIAKISDSYGRTYDSIEEHDAYYLASATLLPASAVMAAVANEQANALAEQFGVSQELVEYRIKRLGLWSKYKGREVKITAAP